MKNARLKARVKIMVAPQGFEPRLNESESSVLPLNEGATRDALERVVRECVSSSADLVRLLFRVASGQTGPVDLLHQTEGTRLSAQRNDLGMGCEERGMKRSGDGNEAFEQRGCGRVEVLVWNAVDAARDDRGKTLPRALRDDLGQR